MSMTIFCDIDGCIMHHHEGQGGISDVFHKPHEITPGTLEKFNEWEAKGYNVILTTGRPECLRDITVSELLRHGLWWDQLVMGLKCYPRVLINDSKPSGMWSAKAIEVSRNDGLGNIDV